MQLGRYLMGNGLHRRWRTVALLVAVVAAVAPAVALQQEASSWR